MVCQNEVFLLNRTIDNIIAKRKKLNLHFLMGAILGYVMIGVVGLSAVAMLLALAFFIKRFLDSQRYNVLTT